MKNYLLFIVLVLISSGFMPVDSDADKATAEATIKGFYSALGKHDFDSLKAFCTSEFHAIEDGQTMNSLDEFIDRAKAFAAYSPQIDLKFVKTDVGSDMAMSIVKFDVTFIKDSSQMNLKTIENYLLKKVEGTWFIDFYQSTYLTDAKKLERGSVLGIHLLNGIELKPGVTNAQVEDFLFNKFVPAFNKLTAEIRVIPLRGLRGENKDKLGMIMFLASDEVRNSFWSDEGILTPKGEEVFNRLEPILKEQDKLFLNNHDPYTDWRVE